MSTPWEIQKSKYNMWTCFYSPIRTGTSVHIFLTPTVKFLKLILFLTSQSPLGVWWLCFLKKLTNWCTKIATSNHIIWLYYQANLLRIKILGRSLYFCIVIHSLLSWFASCEMKFEIDFLTPLRLLETQQLASRVWFVEWQMGIVFDLWNRLFCLIYLSVRIPIWRQIRGLEL